MTEVEILSLILGGLSVLVTLGIGVFAVWQAREYARDAQKSSADMAATEREITTSVRVLEAQTTQLGSILGSQIDRLTAHVTESSVRPDTLIEAMRMFSTGRESPEPAAADTGGNNQLINTQVDVARFAGTLNIFVREFRDQLKELRAQTPAATGKPIEQQPENDLWNHVLNDAYKFFTVYLDRLGRHSEDELKDAGVLSQVEAFRNNYVESVKPAA
jgi:hypothetical protein